MTGGICGTKNSFSLPMRDGNYLEMHNRKRQQYGFSLPMRDGNFRALPAPKK